MQGKLLTGVIAVHLISMGLAFAGDAAVSKPWIERAVPFHLDRSAYTGDLALDALLKLREHGERLFVSQFTDLDGVGRPMATQAIIPTKRRRPGRSRFQRLAGLDANSCASCHNAPITGGAGDFTANVFVSEGFTNTDFDTDDPQFSNERNTNHLFGAGLIELLAREMSVDLAAIRSSAAKLARKSGMAITLPLESKGVSFGQITVEADGVADLSGVEGVDTDLVIRPFSQKGVMTSLRQFTINALNHHHGMQATERFGSRWTSETDFDEDGIEDELSPGDISALVAWQATLPAPVGNEPENELWRRASEKGSRQFDNIGCNVCHIRALPLSSLRFVDPGPLDAAGTLRSGEDGENAVYDIEMLEWAATLERNEDGQFLVPLFGDLKRHRIADNRHAELGNELLAQRFVDRDVFMTAELWGVGSTAPYGHRGNYTTLDGIIRAHGGAASEAARAYESMEEEDRDALIAFLKTLVIKQ
ncbi:MAG: di-heme oxidoredictase family protein [Rhizobiaceae bacterium]